MPWKLQEAERKFGELVRRAVDEGPQVVTSDGHEAVVVVVPAEEYERLKAEPGEDTRPDIKEFLLSGPSFDDLDIRRDKTPGRVIEFDE